MQFKLFSIPATGDVEAEEELNRFLRSHRAVSVFVLVFHRPIFFLALATMTADGGLIENGACYGCRGKSGTKARSRIFSLLEFPCLPGRFWGLIP
jgi:hypothetical protein